MATVTKGVLKLHTKWTARRLAADAMFAAMVTVLAAAAIKTGNLKITIEAMPVFLGARMLGPGDGMVIGGSGTLTDDAGNAVPVHQGETVLVPASVRNLRIAPDGAVKVLTSCIR